MLLQHQLEQYQPFNEQEAKDLELIQILLCRKRIFLNVPAGLPI